MNGRSRQRWWFVAVIVCAAVHGGLVWGQDAPSTPESRDLKVAPKKAATTVAIPRSYAVVIGISAYKNLPAAAQLAFPNRDAEDIYAALISPEGGQFPAENVHKLD